MKFIGENENSVSERLLKKLSSELYLEGRARRCGRGGLEMVLVLKLSSGVSLSNGLSNALRPEAIHLCGFFREMIFQLLTPSISIH